MEAWKAYRTSFKWTKIVFMIILWYFYIFLVTYITHQWNGQVTGQSNSGPHRTVECLLCEEGQSVAILTLSQTSASTHRSSSHNFGRVPWCVVTWLKLDTFNNSDFVHKNTRNMPQHITLVMPEVFERIKLEGGKEIEVDQTMGAGWCMA